MDKPVFYKSWYQMGMSHVNQIAKEQPSTFFVTNRIWKQVSYQGLPFETLWNDIYPPRALEKSKTTNCTTKL